MSKGVFGNLNNSKVKRFLLFLLLAAIFWVFTKFSREFTTSMQTEINYNNIPETTALAQNNIYKLDFDLTANGFEILYYKFKKPSISINVGDYFQNKKLEFEIPNKELSNLIALKYGSSRSIQNLSAESLKVKLDPIILKKVPVNVVKSISYKDGFKAVDSIQITPDSVVISGPEKMIKTINFVETEIFEAENVDKTLSKSILVKKPKEEVIAIKPSKVSVKLKVSEFSQGQFTLPIEVVNLPPNTEIKLIPSAIIVKFDVSVNDFANISKDNFRVVCDYSKLNKEGKFMIPYLETKPKNIYNVFFEPKKIDLLIIK